MKLNVIIPKTEATFGKTVFGGKAKDVAIYDPKTGERTEELEGRVYNLMSEVQCGQVEIFVPATVDELDFKFMEEVEIINPVLKASGKASGFGGKSFAQVTWKCTADTIRRKGSSGTPLKNTGKSET